MSQAAGRCRGGGGGGGRRIRKPREGIGVVPLRKRGQFITLLKQGGRGITSEGLRGISFGVREKERERGERG